MRVTVKRENRVIAVYHHPVPEHWIKAWKRLGLKVTIQEAQP